VELVAELHDLELRANLDPQRPPDSGFAVLAHAWASGHELDEILTGDEDLAGGDFVRNCRLLIDLLRQLRDASPAGTQRDAFRAAILAVDRGVVAASDVSG
jgi:ATP-dependent RNA helicase HelY